LFAGVVSTTPVVVSTWPTLLATPSAEGGVFGAPRDGAVPAPSQRLNHALGGPAVTVNSRHMSPVFTVPGPLA
jgi:hypothetical protein